MNRPLLTSIVGESLTFATGNLVRAMNAARGAVAVEVRGTTLASAGWNFTPRLAKAFKFTAVGSVYRDDTLTLSERGTNTTVTYNSMVATNDFLYVGVEVPFRGAYVNLVNANGTASVLSGFYWDGATWTGLTETDGTTSGGATLAIDNAITWTVPTDWTTTSVNGSAQLFWVRFNSDGGTDSATSLAEVIPLPIQPSVSSAVGGADLPILVGSAAAANMYYFDTDLIGGIELTEANTGVIRVEWLCAGKAALAFVQ